MASVAFAHQVELPVRQASPQFEISWKLPFFVDAGIFTDRSISEVVLRAVKGGVSVVLLGSSTPNDPTKTPVLPIDQVKTLVEQVKVPIVLLQPYTLQDVIASKAAGYVVAGKSLNPDPNAPAPPSLSSIRQQLPGKLVGSIVFDPNDVDVDTNPDFYWSIIAWPGKDRAELIKTHGGPVLDAVARKDANIPVIVLGGIRLDNVVSTVKDLEQVSKEGIRTLKGLVVVSAVSNVSGSLNTVEATAKQFRKLVEETVH